MMSREDLGKAQELDAHLKAIADGLTYCQPGIFKEAFITICGVGHNTTGVNGKPQNMETRIPVTQEFVQRMLLNLQSHDQNQLHDLGIGP